MGGDGSQGGVWVLKGEFSGPNFGYPSQFCLWLGMVVASVGQPGSRQGTPLADAQMGLGMMHLSSRNLWDLAGQGSRVCGVGSHPCSLHDAQQER